MKGLLVVSGLLAFVGFLAAAGVTIGVALLGIACWLGILVRISQADKHHHEVLQALASRQSV